jgi:hypothetical protein
MSEMLTVGWGYDCPSRLTRLGAHKLKSNIASVSGKSLVGMGMAQLFICLPCTLLVHSGHP